MAKAVQAAGGLWFLWRTAKSGKFRPGGSSERLGLPQSQTSEGRRANSSANTKAVANLNQAVASPPTQAQVQALADKLDELILALRRT